MQTIKNKKLEKSEFYFVIDRNKVICYTLIHITRRQFHFISSFAQTFTLRCILQIKHDLDCSTTTSTCFKGLFHFFLGETKPMRDKGLYINLSASKELQTQWPGVLVAKHPHHIHFPAFAIMLINLRVKGSDGF